jgi:hypothetical protein
MMLFHAPAVNRGSRRGSWTRPASRLREAEQRAARLSLSVQQRRHCSASRLTELQAAAASAVPNAFGSVRRHAFCCFPHASPALVFGAGKPKTAPRDRSKPVISLMKSGAGEGIRTLDPNLGKVVLYP